MVSIICVLAGLVFYVYVGYPMLIGFLGMVRSEPVRKGAYTPFTTIIIAAYNEAEHIARTIENKLNQDYPQEKIEIIVVSDTSDDGTDEIVEGFGDRHVRLIRQEPRQGKTAALNLAATEARGEILVFSDANSIYSPNALKELVSAFADPTVGYVTGKMVYMTRQGASVTEGCSSYMKYENLLRRRETMVGSIVGVDGGIDATRRELYTEMAPELLPDFVLPMNIVEQGWRVVYEPTAVLREEALAEVGSEYRMRVRVSLRAFHALWHKRNLFNFFRYGLFSFQLVSHKLLRYFVGVFLILIFACSFAVGTPLSLWLVGVQMVFYAMALIGYCFSRAGRSYRVFYYPFYFVLINLAASVALVSFLRGRHQVTWTPRGGTAG